MNIYLTPNMLFREAEHVAKEYHTTINNVCLSDDCEKFSIVRNGKEFYTILHPSDLLMSLDDFSERIIRPLLFRLLDWERAFNIDTYK